MSVFLPEEFHYPYRIGHDTEVTASDRRHDFCVRMRGIPLMILLAGYVVIRRVADTRRNRRVNPRELFRETLRLSHEVENDGGIILRFAPPHLYDAPTGLGRPFSPERVPRHHVDEQLPRQQAYDEVRRQQ